MATKKPRKKKEVVVEAPKEPNEVRLEFPEVDYGSSSRIGVDSRSSVKDTPCNATSGSSCRDYVINDIVNAMPVKSRLFVSFNRYVYENGSFDANNKPAWDKHSDMVADMAAESLSKLFQVEGIKGWSNKELDRVGVELVGDAHQNPFAASFTTMFIRTFPLIGMFEVEEIRDITKYPERATAKISDARRIKLNDSLFHMKWRQFLNIVPLLVKAYRFTPEFAKYSVEPESPEAKLARPKEPSNWHEVAVWFSKDEYVDLYLWGHSQITVMATWEMMANLWFAHQHQIPLSAVPRGGTSYRKKIPGHPDLKWCKEQDTLRAGEQGAEKDYNRLLTFVPLYHHGILLTNPITDEDKPVVLGKEFCERLQ